MSCAMSAARFRGLHLLEWSVAFAAIVGAVLADHSCAVLLHSRESSGDSAIIDNVSHLVLEKFSKVVPSDVESDAEEDPIKVP